MDMNRRLLPLCVICSLPRKSIKTRYSGLHGTNNNMFKSYLHLVGLHIRHKLDAPTYLDILFLILKQQTYLQRFIIILFDSNYLASECSC